MRFNFVLSISQNVKYLENVPAWLSNVDSVEGCRRNSVSIFLNISIDIGKSIGS